MTNKEQDNGVEKVPLYQVEGTIVHASKTVKRAHILCCVLAALVLAGLICNVIIVNIFTTKYNDRTDKWITAYREMVLNLTEAEGGKYEGTGDIQQFSPP